MMARDRHNLVESRRIVSGVPGTLPGGELMNNTITYALTCGVLAMGIAATAEAEISRGAVLASTCFTCHGTDGKSPGAIPSIYGVPAASLVKSLGDFKSGMRPATVMDRHAKGYSDADIKAIADYLSTIK
jgi:cytochrome subunit of sulfide dehydrogenase